MRRSTIHSKPIVLTLFLIITALSAIAQLGWVRAYNVNAYYQTDPNAVYTWDGGISNNYCDGYGTIQFYENNIPGGKYRGWVKNGKNEGYGTQYYANGQVYYAGNWKDDQKSGFGTLYYEDGSEKFKGIFVNDQLSHFSDLERAAEQTAVLVVEKIFDGGINIRYGVSKAVFDRTGKLEEMRIRITFNGDFFRSNFYEGTMVIKRKVNLESIDYDVEFVDYNKTFHRYYNFKKWLEVADRLDKIIGKFNRAFS